MVYGVINRVMWSMKNRIKSVVMCVVVGSSPSRPEVVIMIVVMMGIFMMMYRVINKHDVKGRE